MKNIPAYLFLLVGAALLFYSHPIAGGFLVLMSVYMVRV